MSDSSPLSVFVAGATGFVGRHLLPALRAAGVHVVGGSRDPAKAAHTAPDVEWRHADLGDEASMIRAMRGCSVAYDLVHEMGGGGDYPERERRGAEAFRRAAEHNGVDRIVYLGGVMPAGAASKHLESRARTGAILRAGSVETVELRAAMIVGRGSASWTMVRDLAGRLPAMVLPTWTQNHSWPVGIEDVAKALLAAAFLPAGPSRILEVPGPERLSHEEVFRRVAAQLDRRLTAVRVPVLTPRLSSYWVALVTNVDLSMARELVAGVVRDLDPTHATIWSVIGEEPRPLDAVIGSALEDEAASAGEVRAHRRSRLRALARQLRREAHP
ncbi:MAG: NAD(P)H-binding protein [Deltaproteobacteria bacterium]|nr:NAD(P)H-binding protein [Deltaproteobacteria bacterium]